MLVQCVPDPGADPRHQNRKERQQKERFKSLNEHGSSVSVKVQMPFVAGDLSRPACVGFIFFGSVVLNEFLSCMINVYFKKREKFQQSY